MATPTDLAGLQQALNKNDKFDLTRTDSFVEKAEELLRQQLPEKHEHDKEATEKMVAFDRRNSAMSLDNAK
ncbi:conserved hypothetical protein [Neospora caninum Liverpool]|uniref:Uncharacterized protein n=1 Tax=Neospora caninum (strain Liverpool) TaxID=572307 RepID=F0VPM1_NEOCL|nr:conserved hypothetical protein [Neospora caninum Liverpool]CBZ55668.1 conserved hypothetical protein [Neospora caninum Liverpool]CEL70410.1 TPA: hypothetical protein BN1204_060920 [Neospora caninum Liverpool]|eukprot:XP_003885694.1 conserved hypothetical protein [Neospora caninum Liverpool]